MREYVTQGKKREGEKERKKERKKERRNERKEKEGKKRREREGWSAGPRRRRPELAGVGRKWVAKSPKERVVVGASVVQMKRMEFCKRCFGGRTYSSLERV